MLFRSLCVILQRFCVAVFALIWSPDEEDGEFDGAAVTFTCFALVLHVIALACVRRLALHVIR